MPEAFIYVYDNNSTNFIVDIARESGAIMRHEYCQGKGNVIWLVLCEIEATCYQIIDEDHTYPAESVREMYDLVLQG